MNLQNASITPELINPELERKLKTLYSSLDSILKNDAFHDKICYRSDEVSLGTDVNAFNEHTMFNRLKKIGLLVELSEHWDEFKTLYKDNPIINRIGVEFLEDKFYFDSTLLKTMEEYPLRKQVLYYFPKNVPIVAPKVDGNSYFNLKEKILSSIESDSLIHLEQKRKLLSAMEQIRQDKSTENLNYLMSLEDGNSPKGKLNVEVGGTLISIRKNLKEGNFKVTEMDGKTLVELPISSSKNENGVETKYPSTILAIDLKNPKKYSIEAGVLPPKVAMINSKIVDIRAKAFASNDRLKQTLKA